MDWSPLGYPSLITRVAIAKAIGLTVGLLAFFLAPAFYPGVDWYARIGLLLWYPTVGAFVGVFGVMNWHPILHLPLPWWFRSVFIGAWMNLVLIFFAYDGMQEIVLGVTGADISPFWFVLPGALVGGLMGYAATRFGGEGPETTAVLNH